MINAIEKQRLTRERDIADLSSLISLLKKVNGHKNVLKLHDVLEDQNIFYLIFEDAGFTSLGSLIEKRVR